MKVGAALSFCTIVAGLTGCGPKAPDQPLQLSGSLHGQAVIGFVLPKTGQVSMMIGDQACEGVLSDFTEDPRTGLLLCPDASGGVAYHLTATMKNAEAGHLVLGRPGDRQAATIDISSAFGQPQPQ